MKTFLSALLVSALLLTGCSSDGPASSSNSNPVQANPATLQAKLAQADATDGKEDKVISNCLMCGLGMKGQDSQVSAYEGYQVQHCGPGCKQAFDKDPAKWVTQVKIPAASRSN